MRIYYKAEYNQFIPPKYIVSFQQNLRIHQCVCPIVTRV